MISTSLGTPEKPYFLLNLARISFNETDSLASCALISSAAIAEVTRSNCSACDGPVSSLFYICSYMSRGPNLSHLLSEPLYTARRYFKK